MQYAGPLWAVPHRKLLSMFPTLVPPQTTKMPSSVGFKVVIIGFPRIPL